MIVKLHSYDELFIFKTFQERLDYLRLFQQPGARTFGSLRHMNQDFYSSREWKTVRNQVIFRDNGCDLGIPDLVINDRIIVHHMNPITARLLTTKPELALDPLYLITVSERTHLAIHFGRKEEVLIERFPGDTTLW